MNRPPFTLPALLSVAWFYGSVQPSCAQEPAPFRVLTYNVLYGFNHGKAVDLGAEWIAEQHPDLVSLQEMNGFTQATLEPLAKKWGHNHAVILKEDGFPVALTANRPIELIEKALPENSHGFLHCKVRGMHLFVVHLSPSRREVRLREAALITGKAKPLLEAGESVIVLGDFNCNSPLDRNWLEPRPGTHEWRKKEPANADPEYLVMNRFLALGLVDLVHTRQPDTEAARLTFPTRILPQYKTDAQREGKVWRIDYLLTDPALARRCLRAEVSRDPLVHQISDHFPVQASFR